jgi:hypothetical protein
MKAFTKDGFLGKLDAVVNKDTTQKYGLRK